jgi:endogenous inhibitor of DNA gyrase (YacG/DUF329 family)
MRLRCPTCERKIEWSDAYPFRPFCSERCRLIDLGAWLSEQRAIAGQGPEFSDDGGGEGQEPGSGARGTDPGIEQ